MDIIYASGQSNPIKNAADLIKNVVNQYIVRSTSSSVNGFVFDVLDEESMYLDSEITDHYVEENFAVQDHIARRPERFMLRGFVGELTDIFSNTFLSLLTNIQSLSSIGGFLPEFASQATQVYSKIADTASKAGQVLNQAQNVYDIFFQKSTTATKQQNAYNYFYTMWLARTLCTIETPYGVLSNMAIESVRAVQHGDTRFISDITVTFKKIRITSTLAHGPNPYTDIGNVSDEFSKLSMGRADDMLKGVQNNGQTSGRTIDDNGNVIGVSSIQGAFNTWESKQVVR